MKAMLLSVKPEWVEKILNEKKTIEIRKKFPKDYVGWVYIYCTKDKRYANLINRGGFLTGMVVARFYCDKVEEILIKHHSGNLYTNTLSNNKFITKSCLTDREIKDYLSGNWHIARYGNYWFGGYAIHISQLEIFGRPKEIRNIRGAKTCKKCSADGTECANYGCKLTKAPQNYCYLEVEK